MCFPQQLGVVVALIFHESGRKGKGGKEVDGKRAASFRTLIGPFDGLLFSKTSKQLKAFWQEYQRIAATDSFTLNDVFGVEVNGHMYRAQYVCESGVSHLFNVNGQYLVRN